MNLHGPNVVDKFRMSAIVDRVTGADAVPSRRDLANSVLKCVSLVKCYMARTDEEIGDVIDAHGLVPPETEAERAPFIAYVRQCINEGMDRNVRRAGSREAGHDDEFDDSDIPPRLHELSDSRSTTACVSTRRRT